MRSFLQRGKWEVFDRQRNRKLLRESMYNKFGKEKIIKHNKIGKEDIRVCLIVITLVDVSKKIIK